MSTTLLQEAKAMQGTLIEWRRALHQIPELGINLPKTVQFVTEKLEEMGISYEVMEECSCVVAKIGSGDKCIMLRSDMDALPVAEETGLEYASTNGCMHSCGHDLHATILLGAAKLLKEHEAELNGVVKLLFQSGEETLQGAKEALKRGVLENPHVDAAFATHVFANVPPKTVLYGKQIMSAMYTFKITLTGHGGHGSQPENCIDPINAGVAVYEALQSLIARECPPSQEAVLTIGQFAAGNAANVIPERCVLQGTLRTFDRDVTELMVRRINEITQDVAKAYRTKCEIEELSKVPCVQCDETMNQECMNSMKELSDFTFKDTHLMASEDFSIFSDEVPASYFIVGAGVADESKRVGQHNPKILFDEDSLQEGVAVYTKVAMDWLDRYGDK